MVRNVSPIIRDLDTEDFYLLSGLEHGMRFSEWVNRDELPDYAGLTAEAVDYRLDRCLEMELIERQTIQYEGYRLKFEGYDALALRTFSERGTVSSVGAPLGEGKESDVFEAQNEDIVALKFHREGLTNFRAVHRGREYTADREHSSWLYTARKAAEREFEVLETLHPEVSVPAPFDTNRHAIVMERMPGSELSQTKLENEHISPILVRILSELASAYDHGYVHADASEYNVFVDSGGVTIFDWPQAVTVDHPNADDLLKRDISNLVSYFRRKHPSSLEGIPGIPDLVAQVQDQRVNFEG